MEGLKKQWDEAAELIDHDPMRPIRYGTALRYIKDFPRDSRILEVGCGEGTGLSILHSTGFRALSGVEVSGERVRRALAKVPGGIELKELAPDEPLPFDSGMFDLVVSLGVIEHARDPDRFVSDIFRVLKNGSHAVISSDCFTWRILQVIGLYKTVQPIDRAVPMGKMMDRFRGHGFEVIHVDTFRLPERGYPLFGVLREKIAGTVRKRFHKGGSAGIVAPDYETVISRALETGNVPVNTSRSYRFARHLANLIDDENVFLLRKS